MPNAILIHGTPDSAEYFDPKAPSPSNAQWLPWLQKELLIRGCETQTPEMPKAYKPDYEPWRKEFERHLITQETLLVGHSCGGGFLVRWLSENPRSISRVVLVAPWMDPNGNHCAPGFFDFQINPEITRVTDLHLIYSDNDTADVNVSVERIMRSLPDIQKHLMPGKGHFCSSDLGGNEFITLRDILISESPRL